MTTTTDVQNLFTSILRRDGSDDEVANFVAVIDSGTITLAQASQTLNDSTEAAAFVDPIVRLYQAAFGRQPDAAGFDVNVQFLRDGGTVIELTAAFGVAVEFTDRFGTSDTVDSAYLTALYLNVLGRTPSGAEVDAWIATGESRSDILRGFSDSPEFVEKAQDDIDQLLENVAAGTALDPTAPLAETAGGSDEAGVGGVAHGRFIDGHAGHHAGHRPQAH